MATTGTRGSTDRASDYGSEGWGFESLRVRCCDESGACVRQMSLPDLNNQEASEVSAIPSLVGYPLSDGLIYRPSYSDPHHAASAASIVGGGAGDAARE